MDLPPASPKIQRLAEQLANLPLELVDQVIADLPLHKVLELLSASPDLLESDANHSEESFSPLVHAVLISPAWKPAFSSIESTKSLLRTWKGLNQISWLYSRQPFMQSDLVSHAPTACARAGTFHPARGTRASWEMENELAVLMRAVLLGDHKRKMRGLAGRYFCALYQFLPPEADVLLGISTNPPLSGLCLPSQVTPDKGSMRQLDGEALSKSVHDLRESLKHWDSASLLRFLPYLSHAWLGLTTAWSSELESLASLYERFPTLLKPAKAPQSTRVPFNIGHITNRLRQNAKRLRKWRAERPGYSFRPEHHPPESPYPFRYQHNFLMPYDWCLQLFTIVLDEKRPTVPVEIVADLENAIKGLSHVYGFAEANKQYPRFSGSKDEPREMKFILHYEGDSALPSPGAEMKWLNSFLTVVGWMKDQNPDLVAELRGPGMRMYKSGQGKGQTKLLLEKQDYLKWIETTPASDIADYLRRDSQLCNRSGVPSLLAFYMPQFSSPKARLVATSLAPKQDMSLDLQQLLYENTLNKINQYTPPTPAIEVFADYESLDGESLNYHTESEVGGPFNEDNTATGQHAFDPQHPSAHLTNTPPAGQSRSDSWQNTVRKHIVATSDLQAPRALRCYICQRRINQFEIAHKIFRFMCKPCGDFNLAGSTLSLPVNLNLTGKTALVTGARVNLGYYTALRLLRCGARVIATSRYPYDALFRYRGEKDSAEWLDDRLRIVGADFRAARDAFELVEQVKTIVTEWSSAAGSDKPALDILINNAAQTLTDSEPREVKAVKRENELQQTLCWLPQTRALSTKIAYRPRVKGGASSGAFLEGASENQLALPASSSAPASNSVMAPASMPTKSSWVQTISEIPYHDIVAAQSVNALVPLILVRELLPLMSRSEAGRQGHIVNVSSREGIFENKRDHSAKQGHHVHTNMSKAALNMITETEAASAWQKHRVAMNTVDPGYMSAAPEMENNNNGQRPLSWEDGAGRVLWSIAMAEGNEKKIIWGRFLKHYGAKEAIASMG